MAQASVKIVKDSDGGYSVVGVADGVTLVFASVNPSQVNVARREQGLEPVAPPEPAESEEGS